MPVSQTYQMDCMEYMKSIPDQFFELAIVDLPTDLIRKAHKDVANSRTGV